MCLVCHRSGGFQFCLDFCDADKRCLTGHQPGPVAAGRVSMACLCAFHCPHRFDTTGVSHCVRCSRVDYGRGVIYRVGTKIGYRCDRWPQAYRRRDAIRRMVYYDNTNHDNHWI
jgi:hypothetical protein